MGTVTIQLRGSFNKTPDVCFTALEGGHAFALTRAIQHLVSQMQGAIMMDHALQKDGEKPPRSDFGMLPP